MVMPIMSILPFNATCQLHRPTRHAIFCYFLNAFYATPGRPMEKLEYEEYLERKVVVLTRNDRYFYGVLKSFDQYNSITLNFTVERITRDGAYAEKRHGLIVLRGENIVMIGPASSDVPHGMRRCNYDDLIAELNK